MMNPSDLEKPLPDCDLEEMPNIDIVFQTQLYCAIEELHLRRENDTENEKKIQQLMNQKHELEKKLEQQILEHRTIVETVEKSKLELRQEYEDKLHQLQEERMRSNITTERFNKEIGILKDEARALELGKHSLEKKLKEAEASVQVQSSVHETTLQRYSQLGQVIDDVKKQHVQLQNMQQQIEKRVIQVIDYIKKLEFCVRHSRCLLALLEQDKTKLSEKLVKSRTEYLIAKPEDDTSIKATFTQKVTHLEEEIKKLKDENGKLTTEHHSLYNEKKMVVAALSEANAVMNKYMDQASSAAQELKEIQVQRHCLKEQMQQQDLELQQLQQELQKLSSKACKESCTQTDDTYFKQELKQLGALCAPMAALGNADNIQSVFDGNDQSDIEHILGKLLDAVEFLVVSS